MPPRKSNVSAVSNADGEGADTTPAKAAKDGMSVEVCYPKINLKLLSSEHCVTESSGPQPSKVNGSSARQRSIARQYFNTKGRSPRFAQERYGLRQLHRLQVRLCAKYSECAIQTDKHIIVPCSRLRSANELTQAGGKKTIMPPEIMTALKDAEFEDFLPRLEAELKSRFSPLRTSLHIESIVDRRLTTGRVQ